MIKYFNKQKSMKISSYFKKFFIYFCEPILNNKYIIRFIRKPLNTFLFNNLPYKTRALKETKIWRDQSYFKIEFYEEVSSKYIKKFINYILSRTTKKDHILDICCNQGRFLKALHQKGYRSLHGVDIMRDAIKALKESEEYSLGGIYAEENLAQEFILKMKDESIDYAITYSATIELIHPGFNIFKELNRITRKGFIFVLNENGHSYPRFYRYLIKANKFKIKNLISYGDNLTLIHAEKFR